MTKRSILLFLALIIALIWLSAGWTGQPGQSKPSSQRPVKVFTVRDSGKEIRLKQGDLFKIELEAPGATGYQWQVEDLDTSRLILINQSTRMLLSDGRMGSPVTSVFTFRALSEGPADLTIDYYRPWEGRVRSEKTFSLKINIF